LFCFIDLSDSSSDDEDQSENSASNRFNIIRNLSLKTISNEIELNSHENEEERSISVTPGVGCFLTDKTRQSPDVFENYIRLVRSIPQIIIFLRIQYGRVPFIDRNKRLLIKFYGENICHITARFGYAETKNKSIYSDILLLAKELYQFSIPLIENEITYFLPNQIINLSKQGWKTLIPKSILYLYSIQKKLVPIESIYIQINSHNTILIGTIHEL
jgi:K+ transporter